MLYQLSYTRAPPIEPAARDPSSRVALPYPGPVVPPRPPLRVAFVMPSLGIGGAERVAVEQIRALAGEADAVDVFLTGDGARDLEGEARAAHPALGRVARVSTTASLAWRLACGRYDLLVTTGTRKAFRAARWLGRVAPSRRPAVVSTIHTMYANHVESLAPFAQDVDAVAIPYDFRERVVRALLAPPDRVVVTPPFWPSLLAASGSAPAADAGALRASWGVGDDAVVLGYFGRVAENKGIVPLVRAAGRLVATGSDVHVVVAGRVGDGAYEREVAVTAGPLGRRIHRLAWSARSAALLAAFDLFVQWTRRDGPALGPFEALSVGTPALATAVAGISAYLRDGVDAALVAKDEDDGSPPTPGDLARFEARLGGLVGDRAERLRLGAAGRERVRHLVATSDFGARFLEAARAALESRR